MFFLSTPSDERLAEVLAEVGDRPFSYAAVGRTRETLDRAPDGFLLDQYGDVIGTGDRIFERACVALAAFGNYPASFTRVVRATPTLAVGQVFGTLARHFGFVSFHPCRVVYLIDEATPRRFGFGLGTLPGHIEAGEERFLISQDEDDGVVHYDVQAFSRPDGILARMGAKVARSFQLRFQRETLAQMRRRCGAAD